MTRIHNQRHRTNKYSQHSPFILPAWPNGWLFVSKLTGCGFASSSSHLIFDIAHVSSKQFFEIHTNIERGFTLKWVRDIKGIYIQIQRTDKYSQHSSVLWPVCLNGWVFVYELLGFGFEFSSSHLNFRYRASLQEGVPWHSGKYRLWIYSEMRPSHDKNIQSNPPDR